MEMMRMGLEDVVNVLGDRRRHVYHLAGSFRRRCFVTYEDSKNDAAFFSFLFSGKIPVEETSSCADCPEDAEFGANPKHPTSRWGRPSEDVCIFLLDGLCGVASTRGSRFASAGHLVHYTCLKKTFRFGCGSLALCEVPRH
jgi:hypothetical protein